MYGESYWLARQVLRSGIAGVYCSCFLSAAGQFRALLGRRGLTPLRSLSQAGLPRRHRVSIFRAGLPDWLAVLLLVAGAGLSGALAGGLLNRAGYANYLIAWVVVWVLYLSLINAGGIWYGLGWESFLSEVGFLAIFLGPDTMRPPYLVLIGLRWALFRFEFGAGLIKLRNDRCWRELTCLYYHYETQPLPGPFSWHFHQLPPLVHRVMAALNHVVQLGLVLLLFLPQPFAGVAAAAVLLSQLPLALSGNFGPLNLLTIVVAFSAVPDPAAIAAVHRAWVPPPSWYSVSATTALVLIGLLSVPAVRNLISSQQRFNVVHNPLHLANSYGAFGHVSRLRHEIVIEGTSDLELTDDTRWQEYQFAAKVGDPRRRPRQVAPFDRKLDWLMWFVPLSRSYARPWLQVLIYQLLRADGPALRLLRRSPLMDSPPNHIRVVLYRYRFTSRRERAETGAWWCRTFVGVWLAPVARPADRPVPSTPG